MAGYNTIVLVANIFIVSRASSYLPPINSETSAPCDPPAITPVNFHEHVEILVGSNRTFSCVIHSDTSLKEGYPKWTREFGFPLPDHLITTGECSTLYNATCSNLTLINVSQSDGSGYYTITAENECGSDNFTVNVEVVTHPNYCLNATELPPLLIPPPNISAVEGQTVSITATYKGDYAIDDLQAFWIVKTPNSKDNQYIFPNDDPPKGYDVTVQQCPVTNTSCCTFIVSMIVDSVMVNQSGTELKSAAARPNDLIKYTPGYSRIKVYNIPTIIGVPGKECRDLTSGHSTTFTCTYNASSDPNIIITMWSLNGKLLPHNTSHYTMITEYGVNDLDQVRSTLIISKAISDIGGTYTCWCEYNKSMIYGNEMFRSNSASVCLRVGAGSKHSPIKLWELILAGVGMAVLVILLILILSLTCYCCFCKRKRKNNDFNSTILNFDDESTRLLNGENTSSGALDQGNPLLNVAAATVDPTVNTDTEDSDNEIPNSNNNKPLYRQGMDVMEIDGSKELPKIANGDDTALASGITLPNDRTDKLISGHSPGDMEEGLTPTHQKTLHQPGSHMVTGAGNFETVKAEEHKKDNKQQHHNDNDLSAPQQVVATPSLESSDTRTTISAPTGRDGRTIVQEETSPSVTEADEEVTNNNVTTRIVRPSQPIIKRLSTSKPIESEKEAPVSREPAVTTNITENSTTLIESVSIMELDTSNKILNEIAMEFSTLINVDTLLPHLLAHQMLTYDEAYVCRLQLTPPSQRAQELLRYLRSKGSGVLQKLLCCLSMETTHLGHKDVAAKLIQAIKCHVDDELLCPICNPKSDVLDDIFGIICANHPTENWKDLAIALDFDTQRIKQIGELAEEERLIKLILQQWRKLNPEASKDILTAKLHDANLDYEL